MYRKFIPIGADVHHTGGTDADPLADTSHHTFEIVNEFHRTAKKEDGSFVYHNGSPSSLGHYCAYTIFIEKDGKTTYAREDDEIGGHTRFYNDKLIGIGLAGNFDATLPTKEQTEALKRELYRLMKKFPQITPYKIYPHRAFANKSCYGRRLSNTWASDLVNEDPVVIEQLKHQIRILTEKLKALLLRR